MHIHPPTRVSPFSYICSSHFPTTPNNPPLKSIVFLLEIPVYTEYSEANWSPRAASLSPSAQEQQTRQQILHSTSTKSKAVFGSSRNGSFTQQEACLGLPEPQRVVPQASTGTQATEVPTPQRARIPPQAACGTIAWAATQEDTTHDGSKNRASTGQKGRHRREGPASA